RGRGNPRRPHADGHVQRRGYGFFDLHVIGAAPVEVVAGQRARQNRAFHQPVPCVRHGEAQRLRFGVRGIQVRAADELPLVRGGGGGPIAQPPDDAGFRVSNVVALLPVHGGRRQRRDARGRRRGPRAAFVVPERAFVGGIEQPP